MKTIYAGDRLGGVLFDIQKERERQEELKKEGIHKHSLADIPGMNECEALAVLSEEHGEIAKEVSDLRDLRWEMKDDPSFTGELRVDVRHRRQHLRTELIQLAACCAAWCEKLDEQENREQILDARIEDDGEDTRELVEAPAEKFMASNPRIAKVCICDKRQPGVLIHFMKECPFYKEESNHKGYGPKDVTASGSLKSPGLTCPEGGITHPDCDFSNEKCPVHGPLIAQMRL